MSTLEPKQTDSHLWVKDIAENDRVSGCYAVKEKKVGTTRRGETFLSLVLSDRTGEVEAKVWERADAVSALFSEGEIVEVDGVAGSYRGKVQVTLSSVGTPGEAPDPGVYMESAPADVSGMMRSLRKLLSVVTNRPLRSLIDRFLTDQSFMSRFKTAPAAKNFHHGYLGGLLEHTLSVCTLACDVAARYPHLDRDLLVTGAFLHDVGKVRELAFGLTIDYTAEGRLLGHVVMGADMVEEKIRGMEAFPRELAVRLQHMILSHHGEYEFGSPKRPKFLEAVVLHQLDDLDAKIQGVGRFMARDRRDGSWTEFSRMFGRYFLKGRVDPAGDEAEEPVRGEPPAPSSQGSLF